MCDPEPGGTMGSLRRQRDRCDFCSWDLRFEKGGMVAGEIALMSRGIS